MNIGVIVQARTSSTRLPEKVLLDLPYNSGISVLEQVIRRLKKSITLNSIIIATTLDKEDEKIVNVAKKENVNFFQGSKYNVLERYYYAAKENNLDIVVRVTSDCPCIDYDLLDKIVKNHLDSNADYTSNKIKDTYPRGLDVEVFNFNVLEYVFKNASTNFEKEHVTPFIYISHSDMFKLNSFENEEDYSNIRITLDTKEDYALLCYIYESLYEKNNFFLLGDILELYSKKPWISAINEDIAQKKVCCNLSEELEEVIHLCDMQDLNKASDFIKNQISE